MKKLKFDTDALLTVGLIGGLGAAAYFWWQSMQGEGVNVLRLTPGDYSFLNAPGGTVVNGAYVPVGGANIRPMPTTTPNTNPRAS